MNQSEINTHAGEIHEFIKLRGLNPFDEYEVVYVVFQAYTVGLLAAAREVAGVNAKKGNE